MYELQRYTALACGTTLNFDLRFLSPEASGTYFDTQVTFVHE